MKQTSAQNAAAWAWVLQHRTLIRKLVNKFSIAGFDVDDLHSQVLCDLGERAHLFDAKRGQPSTFIVWRIRAARTTMIRKERLSNATTETDMDSMVSPKATNQSENVVLLEQVKKVATPNQWEACQSLMLGLSGIEIRNRMGCGITARNARLYRLADQLT